MTLSRFFFFFFDNKNAFLQNGFYLILGMVMYKIILTYVGKHQR